jgi:hypothetical protein
VWNVGRESATCSLECIIRSLLGLGAISLGGEEIHENKQVTYMKIISSTNYEVSGSPGTLGFFPHH